MSHEVRFNNREAAGGRPFLPIVKNCAFPAQELLRYRRRLLHDMTKLPEGDSSLRHESIKHSLRAIDTLARAHESIRGCDCFIRLRQRRIEVEAARRERREVQRRTA